MSELEARAVSFGSTAELYELGRPGYPPDLLEELFAAIGASRAPGAPALRILDLGAGTGKLTRQLTAFGEVTAVEPLDEMREQLQRVLPTVPCLAGTAEAIPVADDSVDVVTVGQAYHWFDQSRANPEIARVLADGGHLVALWNFEDPDVEWVRALMRITGDDPMPAEAKGFGWQDRFRAEPWFTAGRTLDGSMTVLRTKAQQLANIESHSFLSVRPPSERRPLLDQVAALIEPFPDPFEVPYLTEAHLCAKRPPAGS